MIENMAATHFDASLDEEGNNHIQNSSAVKSTDNTSEFVSKSDTTQSSSHN
jgi:hypothetical protein